MQNKEIRHLEQIVVNVAETPLLERALSRQMRPPDISAAVDLAEVLKEILSWANRFVPSHSGSVMIDDPVAPPGPGGLRDLYFLACFGLGSENIVGTRLDESKGIAGETYLKGCPYISKDVKHDSKFFPDIDAMTEHKSLSIICAPVVVEGRIIGVIELINRIGRVSFDGSDLVLLEIFAGYTGTLIENALSARAFKEMSRRDNLTGLYNDRYFFHALRFELVRAIDTGGDVSLVFFDLDHFKTVNDTFGHMAGSRVLKEVADVLRGVFTQGDEVMARYGGDEYVVVLPGAGISDAAAMSERMRAAIAGFTFIKQPGSHGEFPLDIADLITCSVGVASLRHNLSAEWSPEQLVDDLIRKADRAMYESKENGKDRVTVSSEHTL